VAATVVDAIEMSMEKTFFWSWNGYKSNAWIVAVIHRK